MISDDKFPWIDFPPNPVIGQRWVVRSKVMPTFATWEFRGKPEGWVCVSDD